VWGCVCVRGVCVVCVCVCVCEKYLVGLLTDESKFFEVCCIKSILMPFICTSLLIYRNIVTDTKVPKFAVGSFSKETVSKVVLSALANCRLQWNLSYIQISSYIDKTYLLTKYSVLCLNQDPVVPYVTSIA